MVQGRKFASLEKKLAYHFADKDLLLRALTHASARKGKAASVDNERLEFLGDRVLGLAAAELVVELLPTANEGELARAFNRLVRKETCAKVARAIGLGPFLILSESEAASGGREKDTILADAVEAVLGAVFLERGFESARNLVRTLWKDEANSVPQVFIDAKSALQEWAQGRGLALPEYVEIAREGPDHAPRFTSEVRITGLAPARGEGLSKRAAEQAAASCLLVREGVREKEISSSDV